MMLESTTILEAKDATLSIYYWWDHKVLLFLSFFKGLINGFQLVLKQSHSKGH